MANEKPSFQPRPLALSHYLREKPWGRGCHLYVVWRGSLKTTQASPGVVGPNTKDHVVS